LDLSGTQVRGPGLAHLASLSRLQELSLDATALRDADLHHLAGLCPLVVLSLEGTQVTAPAVEGLKLPRLKTMLLSDCKVTVAPSRR
jgi:hypothetical protein